MRYVWLFVKPGGNSGGIRALLAHAQGQRFHTAQNQLCLERAEQAAQQLRVTPQRIAHERGARHHHTADLIGMAAQVFRSAMNYNIGT